MERYSVLNAAINDFYENMLQDFPAILLHFKAAAAAKKTL